MSTTDDLLPLDPDAVGPIFTLDLMGDEDEGDGNEPVPEDAYTDVTSDLDPRHREDFVGLLYLGRLEEECTIAGHKFLLRTPSMDERLEMGQVIKPYMESAGTERAWQVLTVAAYLRKIDSQWAPAPLTDQDTGLRERFSWVKASIAAEVVIERLYDRCGALELRVRKVIAELDRLGER